MPWGTRTDRIAEGDVERLCQVAKGRVTRVNEDENGWDLLVEFPPAIETAFADLDPPLRRCIIQVKSTRTRRASAKMKLSNALALAKDPLPCLTILLTYPSGPEAFEAAYLQHMWGRAMFEALRRTCEAQAAGKPLHKQYVPLLFGPGERHDKDVISALLKAVDAVGPDYAEKKRQLLEGMGYENGAGELNFTVEGEDPARDLDDLLLGLKPAIQLASLTHVEKRFDIVRAERELGPAKLSLLDSPKKRCVLGIRRGDEELVWPGEVLTGLDFAGTRSRRVRFVGGPLSVILSGDGIAKLTWSMPLDKPRPLDELLREARFRSWMDGAEVALSIWTERGEFQPIPMKFDATEADPLWPNVLSAIRALTAVIPTERRPADLEVSLSEIIHRLSTHLMLAGLCGAEPRAMRIVPGQEMNSQGLEKSTHVLVPWASRLGEYFLVSVVERRVISVRPGDDHIELHTVDGCLLRGTAIKAADATDALLAREVRWARETAKLSGRRTLSFLPEGDGTGTFELTWDGEDTDEDGVAQE